MNNLLDSFYFTTINFAEPSIGGIANIVKWIVGIGTSVTLGIVLFTIILNLITFPFDFLSKYSMRKNSVKMEEMRPELERLQKQYADNKALYSQKMMALYKKNGYSMWGTCLSTLLTLAIFIIAITGFTSYSKYQNNLDFYNMSLAYNSALYEDVSADTILKDYVIYENGKIELNVDVVKNSDKIEEEKNDEGEPIGYKIKGDKYTLHCTNEYAIKDGTGYEANKEEFLNATKEKARIKSADKYNEQESSFLWVQNIWNVDSPIDHPVYKTWELENGASCLNSCGIGGKKAFITTKKDYDKGSSNENMSQELYDELTYNLGDKKDTPNGFFILCVLSAGISLVMQLVMSKSQKAQMELQTVDGQGARQQKIMLWMMPILMAYFSFMYTAAFSIYLIIRSIISIGTTFLINWVVNKKLGKIKPAGEKEVIRGRVYNKPVEDKKNDKNKKVKKQKVRDFIQGDEENKSIRDRLDRLK